MNIPLNRESGVPIRDQLVVYPEMRILDETLKPGERLPSVRALARRSGPRPPRTPGGTRPDRLGLARPPLPPYP